MNPDALSCLALRYDLCQPIPAPGLVALCTVEDDSSRCTIVTQRTPWPAGAVLRDHMFWVEREEGLTRQPLGPFVDTATISITTVMSTIRV